MRSRVTIVSTSLSHIAITQQLYAPARKEYETKLENKRLSLTSTSKHRSCTQRYQALVGRKLVHSSAVGAQQLPNPQCSNGRCSSATDPVYCRSVLIQLPMPRQLTLHLPVLISFRTRLPCRCTRMPLCSTTPALSPCFCTKNKTLVEIALVPAIEPS